MAPAEGLGLTCPHCGAELPSSALEPAGTQCSVCRMRAQAVIFPAIFRSTEPVIDQFVLAGEAACYFHADRIAAVACGRCGRFLCQMCRIPWVREDFARLALRGKRPTRWLPGFTAMTRSRSRLARSR